jgi:hypothetical protein
VKRLNKFWEIIDLIQERYSKICFYTDSIQQSILAKAFSGELVSQDPCDEPASVLLERIKVEKLLMSKKGKAVVEKEKTKPVVEKSKTHENKKWCFDVMKYMGLSVDAFEKTGYPRGQVFHTKMTYLGQVIYKIPGLSVRYSINRHDPGETTYYYAWLKCQHSL